MAKIPSYPALLKNALSVNDQFILDHSDDTRNMTVTEMNKQWATVTALAAASTGSFDFAQSATPTATASGQTWLDTDDGAVYVSTGTGTGSWGSAVYELMLFGNLTGAIGNLSTPLVDYDLSHDTRKIVRGEGSDTFTRSTVQNIVDLYGVTKEIAIDNSGAESNGTKFEGPSTNLLTYSSDFSNAVHSATNVTKGTSSTAGIDSTVASNDDMTEDGTTAEHYVDMAYTTTSGETVTVSRFVKIKAGTRNIRLVIGNSADIGTIFNITSGTVVSGGGSIQELANGWFRIQDSFLLNASGATIVRTQMMDGSTFSYAGDSTSSFYLDGMQLEVLPFASSWINSVASPLTRTANISSIPYAGNFPAPEDDMTIIMDFVYDGGIVGGFQSLFKVIGETNRNMFIAQSDSKIYLYHGSTSLTSTTTIVKGQKYRVGYVNNGTNLFLYLDGVLKASIAQEVVTGLATGAVQIGATSAAGASPFYGNIDNLKVFKRALTASEMRIA